ncbi:MAG: hypothetical protein Q4A98_03290 [Comamonadaceae bacterium]|nr:hypothetical protein [Comamonadaceae bacterium]
MILSSSLFRLWVTGIEHLRYQWEVLAAVFTSDTIAEATQRHKERLAEMNRIFAEMYADATEGSNAAQGAMDTASTSTRSTPRPTAIWPRFSASRGPSVSCPCPRRIASAKSVVRA